MTTRSSFMVWTFVILCTLKLHTTFLLGQKVGQADKAPTNYSINAKNLIDSNNSLESLNIGQITNVIVILGVFWKYATILSCKNLISSNEHHLTKNPWICPKWQVFMDFIFNTISAKYCNIWCDYDFFIHLVVFSLYKTSLPRWDPKGGNTAFWMSFSSHHGAIWHDTINKPVPKLIKSAGFTWISSRQSQTVVKIWNGKPYAISFFSGIYYYLRHSCLPK